MSIDQNTNNMKEKPNTYNYSSKDSINLSNTYSNNENLKKNNFEISEIQKKSVENMLSDKSGNSNNIINKAIQIPNSSQFQVDPNLSVNFQKQQNINPNPTSFINPNLTSNINPFSNQMYNNTNYNQVSNIPILNIGNVPPINPNIYPVQNPLFYNIPNQETIHHIPKKDSYLRIFLYKYLYNGFNSFASCVTAKLITLSFDRLLYKDTLESHYYPTKREKILSNFDSYKSIGTIIPFAFALHTNIYLNKIIYDYLSLEENKYNKFLKTEINIISSFSMGYLFSKPLNVFDVVLMWLFNLIEVKGESLDTKDIRKKIKENQYDNIHRKLSNYSTLVYSLQYGVFFGLYNTGKICNEYFRKNHFTGNFCLALTSSFIANSIVYPFDLVRKKSAYDIVTIHKDYLDSKEKLPKQKFMLDVKDLYENVKILLKNENNTELIKNGIKNRFILSIFTAFGVGIFEHFRI